jgi:hypothetical protein
MYVEFMNAMPLEWCTFGSHNCKIKEGLGIAFFKNNKVILKFFQSLTMNHWK